MNISKIIGGILLIVGTSIGAGMLALPIAVSKVGFYPSIFYLLGCWLIMTMGALLVLEVNLRLPQGSNMVSMARENLGKPGQFIAWITYLTLLYSLLSAYISGGSDVFSAILENANIHLHPMITSVLFTIIFGTIVYQGIKAVDYVNRGLMFGKLFVYAVLIIIIAPHVRLPQLTGGDASTINASLMVLITSFGFASIVPTLREYFDSDVKSLRIVILGGSIIPLACYIVWIGVIMGVVPKTGPYSLQALLDSPHATSGLTQALNLALHYPWITNLFSFFTSICMLTAFLGVSIGLFDFLADGLKLNRSGVQGKFTFILTFIPPLLFVIINPGIYLHALGYAGVCCVILLLLLPSIMAMIGRKTHQSSIKLLPYGNFLLPPLILVACYLLYIGWTN